MSDLPGSVRTMIDKEELLTLLEGYYEQETKDNEETWDDLYDNGDDEAIAFDKGWSAGFSYAMYLIGENF